jgi:uncharacterized protein (TIRG00374 family)
LSGAFLMRVFRIVAGFAIAILFAILLMRNVDVHEVLRATRLFGLKALAGSVGLVLVGYSLRARRWQLLLKGAGVSANVGEALSLFFASFALNNVLPLRAGDIYRCASASRLSEGTIAKSLATLLTERLLDLAALTVLLGVLLFFFPKSVGLVPSPIAVLLVVALLILVALIGFPAQTRQAVEALVVRGLTRIRIMARAATWISALAAAVEGSLSGHWRLRVIGLTILAWTIELGVFAVIASALSGEILLSGLYAGVLGTLATLIPSAPGHWGTFDFFAAQGFRYSGFDAEKAVAAAIVCHLVIIVPVTLVGAFQLMTNRQARRDGS